MRILVTGANGFLGANLCRALLDLSKAREKRYAVQLDVSYADELSDDELRRLVRENSIYISAYICVSSHTQQGSN